MKTIELSQGKVALVDDDDYEYLNQFKWSVQKKKHIFYALRNVRYGKKNRTCYMHREILKPSPQQQVDHKDGDGLNNQRNNIRVCNFSQNNANRRSVGFSKYLGVYWFKQGRRWVARIRTNKKQLYIGRFTDEAAAAIAYNEAAQKYHGEFARLNTIRNDIYNG